MSFSIIFNRMKKRLFLAILLFLLFLFPLWSEVLTYHSVLEEDNVIRLNVDWDFSLLDDSSKGYVDEIAKAAIVLSREIYVSKEALSDSVEKLGYRKLWLEEEENGISEPVVAFAYRRVKGTNYFLIVVRGTASTSDVLTDIKSLFDNFRHAQEYIMEMFETYLEEVVGKSPERIKKDKNVFLVTGHSMGGACANLLSLSLEEYADRNSIFTYTFACPSVEVENGEGVTNAINIINENDPVPQMITPIGRYGTDIIFLPETVTDWIYSVITERNLEDICGFTILNKWENHRMDVYFTYVITRSYTIEKKEW